MTVHKNKRRRRLGFRCGRRQADEGWCSHADNEDLRVTGGQESGGLLSLSPSSILGLRSSDEDLGCMEGKGSGANGKGGGGILRNTRTKKYLDRCRSRIMTN